MKPYPWSERKRFMDQRRVGKTLYPVSIALTILGVLLCAPAWALRLWAHFGFDRVNDSWSKRGRWLVIAGVVLTATVWSVGDWLGAWQDALMSLGDKATMEPLPAFSIAVAWGAPPSLIVYGLAAVISSYDYEFSAERWAYATKPTWRARFRYARNVAALRAGVPSKHTPARVKAAAKARAKALKNVDADGAVLASLEEKAPTGSTVRFGVIHDDVIPWRTARFGQVVERPLEGLGHGVITGASGSGKTQASLRLAHDTVQSGGAVAFIDFKASRETQRALRAIAEEVGVDFFSFDLGLRSGEKTSYDPLAWDGSPSEKASLMMDAFHFAEGGGADFYKGAAQTWLNLQFEVMAEVGLTANESSFDFLLATASPAGLAERVQELAKYPDGSPQRAKYLEWKDRSAETKADHLAGLRNNLHAVVNSAGQRLRPAADGTPPLSFAHVATHGGIAYVGLSAATDATALKVLGSLAIRDLTALSGKRGRVDNLATLRDMVVIPDEASRLGDRAVVMDDLFAIARESKMWLWPVTQSFSTWPSSTRTEMETNASTHVVYRVPDYETAESITNGLGTIPMVSETIEESVAHRAFQQHSVGDEGDARMTFQRGPHLRADRLLSIPDRHAYVWFSGSQKQATLKPWKSRRVRNDEIAADAPLVAAVALNVALNPPEPAGEVRQFDQMVAAPEQILSRHAMPGVSGSTSLAEPATEREKALLGEYRKARNAARVLGQPAPVTPEQPVWVEVPAPQWVEVPADAPTDEADEWAAEPPTAGSSIAPVPATTTPALSSAVPPVPAPPAVPAAPEPAGKERPSDAWT